MTLIPARLGVAIVTDVLTLPFPPVAGGIAYLETSRWANVVECEIQVTGKINAGAAFTLVDAELMVGCLSALLVADDDFTANGATNVVTAAGHGLETGDGPLSLTNAGGALPAELLAAAAGVYFIKIDANTGKFAASFADSLAGTAINFTGNGTGTHTLHDIPGTTKRITWDSVGLLGPAFDGVCELSSNRSHRATVKHTRSAVAYALIGDMTDADPETVSANISPTKSEV